MHDASVDTLQPRLFAYKRALRGYEKVIKPENLSTYIPTLNTMWGLAYLFDRQHRVEEARAWYSKALLGYESVVETAHPKCHSLRSNLATLDAGQDVVYSLQAELPVHRTSKVSPASTKVKGAKSVPKWHIILSRFKWKER